MQLFTIIASRGDMLLLGEAYAFGVVWSFVFKAMAMMVLRFKQPGHREYMVPLNYKVGNIELPVGLLLIFLTLLVAAIMNLLTKETATIWGLAFTGVFLTIFVVTEKFHEKRLKGAHHHHLEQFNQATAEHLTVESLGLTKKYHKLVAIRSKFNLFMLERALAEADPATTDVIVMTAKTNATADMADHDLDRYDQELMTAVVDKAEHIGKEIKPLIVPTNNPLYAVLQTAKNLKVQEVVLGGSNKFTPQEQWDQIALFWITLHDGTPTPLTVRILSSNRDVTFDFEGGNRIPRINEAKLRSVSELRSAGIGVNRVLLIHEGGKSSGDLYQSLLTMLDHDVHLDLVSLGGPMTEEIERAKRLGRDIKIHAITEDHGNALVKLAQDERYEVIFIPTFDAQPAWVEQLVTYGPSQVYTMAKAGGIA